MRDLAKAFDPGILAKAVLVVVVLVASDDAVHEPFATVVAAGWATTVYST